MLCDLDLDLFEASHTLNTCCIKMPLWFGNEVWTMPKEWGRHAYSLRSSFPCDLFSRTLDRMALAMPTVPSEAGVCSFESAPRVPSWRDYRKYI